MNPFPFIILIILSIYLSMVYTLFEFDSKNDKTDSILTCISFYLMMINFSILLLLVYTLYPYLSIYFLITKKEDVPPEAVLICDTSSFRVILNNNTFLKNVQLSS